MFYSIKVELIHCELSTVVVEAGGVGYQMTVSDRTSGALSDKTGSVVRLFTHLAVREDGVELFGFLSREELEMFRLLNTVSGVGPKMSVSILSALSPDALVSAVISQDVKAITAAQGVGAKIAQRIILELKDKAAKTPSAAFSPINSPSQPSGDISGAAEAVNALTVLGYSRQQAVDAVKGVNTAGKSVEAVIREALRSLNVK